MLKKRWKFIFIVLVERISWDLGSITYLGWQYQKVYKGSNSQLKMKYDDLIRQVISEIRR